MRSQKTQNKSQNKLLFCKLCSYMTESVEDLDLHYKLSHGFDDNDDIILKIEKVPKSLKGKAIKQLKLLVNGKTFRDEYLGLCEQRYYIGRIGNTITLLPYATLC